jgi:hypothetical protein
MNRTHPNCHGLAIIRWHRVATPVANLLPFLLWSIYKLLISFAWRGAGAVERGGLEMRL